MRVDALHRRIEEDVNLMYDAVTESLPVKMPTQYTERQMNIAPFLTKLNRQLQPHNIAVERRDDTVNPEGTLTQDAEWFNQLLLPEEKSDIKIYWHLHPDTHRLTLTPRTWNRRRFFFWQLIMHELVHRHQFAGDMTRATRVYRVQTTDLKELAELEYYADCDEIEAYGHNAAMEFALWWPEATLSQAKKLVFEKKFINTPTYLLYWDAFRNDRKHPAFLHFKRKLKSWFDVICSNREFYRSMELVQ